MDKDILKIDLDINSKPKAIAQLKWRLSYMHDLKFFDFKNIEKIYLIKKKSYGCKILLKEEVPKEWLIIVLQLMLGSDYMKEVNTCLNHYKLEMDYSNRLFDLKRYKDGKIRRSQKIDITQDVKDYIYDPKRTKKYN